jgi:hypothetical protein
MHLGHPMIFSNKDRNRAYNFIYSKFHAKFGSIKANKLNHASRLQYIKSVLSSILVYYMSTVLFSNTFIAKINAIIENSGGQVLTVKIRQPSHEFTFGVGMSFIPYPLVLTPVV